MTLYFDSHSTRKAQYLESSTEDSWSAPLVPGVFDLDPCADSPIKMNFDFEPLQYEVKLSHKSGMPAPGARLISSKWAASKGDIGLGLFQPETQHIEDIHQPSSSSPISAPTPTRLQRLAPAPLATVPSPSLLRAPRLPTRPLLMSSPNSPLIPADSGTCSVIPPVEGTRPPAPPRFSALGLDLTAFAPELSYPSPPASPSAGRECRASTLEGPLNEERGRTRERVRRAEVEEDVPGLTFSVDDGTLHSRVANWSCAVYVATNSGPSTPPESTPISLPLYDEVELATALGRLNADSVGPVRIPSASIDAVQSPPVQRAASLQHEGYCDTLQQDAAAKLGPWAARVGQSRGRLVNMPRLQRAATSSSAQRAGRSPRQFAL
ncbi:hypothetical protein CC85DRAFT_318317 [Cutaneotrichosporon oleaginosum]|uniref:Uncharacterized protein n=1 Tax=Cutaneotrichosporon oleaginosum TaxID=879819 RepID=A0A0J1B4Q0_9TREE|nr:uncharacterized protein CC85DRAFT_318317 [Cutaneotrichosporon oleaginosum]KLT42654.1 hypothetical protein CC85DRAFT_318317 [Cutaneotrichosporon oleaginosum]TXT05229.1 hypothetical protein COLE_06549 [Cutaneotrichosporon oleaginosum]